VVVAGRPRPTRGQGRVSVLESFPGLRSGWDVSVETARARWGTAPEEGSSGVAGGQGSLPSVVVVHRDGSVPPMALAASAAGTCRLVWVCDPGTRSGPRDLRLLERLGAVVAVPGLDPDATAAGVDVFGPSGIVAFSDEDLQLTSELASRLGLAFHSPEVARRLLDKQCQREALARAGMPVPLIEPIPPDAAPSGWRAAAGRVGYPCVLKPRRGSASHDTYLVTDAATLERYRRQVEGTEMVLEEYLPDGGVASPFADYCCVESVVAAGSVRHLVLSGRLPLASPFRETGFVAPAGFAPADTEALLEVASQAAVALGARDGPLRTEIKLTPGGPRVLEVNGRPSGAVPQAVALAGGPDLYQVALRAALGELPPGGGLLPLPGIGYRLLYQPLHSGVVEAVAGLDHVAGLPGVDAVALHRGPGSVIDMRQGTDTFVVSVNGRVAEHADVVDVFEAMWKWVEVTMADPPA